MSVEWETVSLWQDAILRDRLDDIRASFVESGAVGPDASWAPEREAVRGRENKILLEYWHESRGDQAMPPISAVDPVRIQPALGRVAVLEAVEGGRDFRYRLFGTVMTAVSGFDMTGKLLSTHPSSAYIVNFNMALYRAILIKRVPVLSSYKPVARYAAFWERLMLPFGTEVDGVIRIVTGNIAFDRDGRELQS